MDKPVPPETSRGKIVYFIWNNLPRFSLVCLIVLIIILSIFIIARNHKTIAANEAMSIHRNKPAINVVTLTLSPTTITDRINLPGYVEPWTKLRLMSKLNGTISKVLAKPGDKIGKGDILAHIEDDDYRIAMERANAAYNQAKASYKRAKSIYDKGGLPTAIIETDRTTLQTAKADYEHAKLLLSRTIITSPMDGIIKSMDAKVGLLLSVGDPVAEILEIDRMKIVVGIPESDVTAVRMVKDVDITIQALNNRVINAKKYFLSPAPETTARVYHLELETNNSAGEILAGMFIRADIVKKRLDNALTIPFYSVISRNGEQFVYIEEEGLARKRSVTLGIMEGWRIEITAGLKPGDRVLIEGHRDVEDGQKINLVKVITNMEELIL